MMKFTLRPFLLSFFLLFPIMAHGEDIVVVVHPQSSVNRLSRTEVTNIFLGRFRQFSSGAAAQPVDLPSAHPAKARFYRLLVNKDLAEINSYWSRLVFSGRTAPPVEAKSYGDLLNIISKTPGAIGYIERSKLDAWLKPEARVKVVYELET